MKWVLVVFFFQKPYLVSNAGVSPRSAPRRKTETIAAEGPCEETQETRHMLAVKYLLQSVLQLLGTHVSRHEPAPSKSLRPGLHPLVATFLGAARLEPPACPEELEAESRYLFHLFSAESGPRIAQTFAQTGNFHPNILIGKHSNWKSSSYWKPLTVISTYKKCTFLPLFWLLYY